MRCLAPPKIVRNAAVLFFKSLPLAAPGSILARGACYIGNFVVALKRSNQTRDNTTICGFYALFMCVSVTKLQDQTFKSDINFMANCS